MAKDGSKNGQAEGNENQFERNLTSSIDIPLSRTPLNAIPDPSQFSKEFLQEVVLQSGFRDKCLEPGSSSNRRKLESAHATPARSVSRTTYVGQLGACTGPRALQSTGERVGSSSRVSRRISNVNCEPQPTEVPHFELVEDPSFWNDHNVQVLIRMRPLSNMEKMAQGHDRCLRQESLQSLVWLGHPEIRFRFDHIVCETISQEKLFRVAGLPMVDNCMSGYNSCMFAYGQTGSGKTYTMMGEIRQRDGKLVDDCGITPRLFEYLFSRIKLEEESRRDERLKYSCKCSFLEIYNEQITDLLEPSSTNLQLREDLKEGVYVENLTEYYVKTVDEVLKLLLQGAANRKVAGTDMNSESSRSHSVFTCIVESRWEKDSMTHLRFGRLNLVDLAGSERQRSSGAGERLKEASYINKSLSTLGLVIMSLVDVAHGKHRHVPYRDSRLTFLLQDSLGGNSKTTIIANVSPSMCAANETLSTLKFAQRAKLIQNNAKVNEDASGDVTALQQQIQMLKEQMSLLMKHQKISKPLFQVGPTFQPSLGEYFEREDPSNENICDDNDVLNDQKRKVETVSKDIDLGDEIKAPDPVKDDILLDHNGQEHSTDIIKELMDARILLEAMKSQQDSLVEELYHVRQENDRLVETLSNKKKAEIHPMLNESHISENGRLEAIEEVTGESMTDLEVRLDKMTKDVKDIGLLNDLEDISHASCIEKVDFTQEEVGNEATKAIFRLQEQLASLQVKYHRRLCTMSEENKKLRGIIAVKEDELYSLHTDWERASLELTSFLLEGSRSLKDASGQIESIACSFPRYNVLVGEHVKKAATVCMEKEQTILRLEKNLVDAQTTILQMQEKLNSLRNATMALTEIQYTEHDASTIEVNLVDLQDHANTTFLEAKGLQIDVDPADMVRSRLGASTTESEPDSQMNSYAKTSALIDIENQVEMAKQGLNETKAAFNMSRVDAEMYLSTFQAEIHKAFSLYKDLVEDLMKEIREMRKNLVEFKDNHKETQLEEACTHQMQGNQWPMLHQIVIELVSLKNILDTVNVYLRSIHDSQVIFGDSDGWTTDVSTPSSILSDDENVPENESPLGVIEKQTLYEGGSKCSSVNQESEKHDTYMISLGRVRKEHMFLKKQFNMAYEAFVKLDVQLAAVFKDKEYEVMQSLECVKPDEKAPSRDVLNHLQYPDFVTEEKACTTSCFFSKFEEASATMNEADNMLNLLLKANKEAKMLTGRWKQVAEELMAEKASLVEEIKQLKLDVHLRDEKHAALEEQSRCNSIELANSVSMLEGCIQHMQKEAEDLCHVTYSDALAMIQGFQHHICKSRSSLEDIFAETMEKSFASFVIQQCHFGEYVNKFGIRANYGHWPSSLHEEIMEHVEALRTGHNHSMSNVVHGEEEENYSDDLINENVKIKKELERKNILLNGLLFDFSLLQESASTRKDIKDEAERLFTALSQVQHELKMKTHQLDDMVVKYENLEHCLADTEAALCDTRSVLEHAEETVDSLSYQNAELRGLLEDLYHKKSETEMQLEEQREVVKSLEKEIYLTASSAQEQFLNSLEGITDDLKRVSSERDQLCEQVSSLQDRLEMAYAIADENEAIAVEARQESEASKIYAEEKEEEVKILEHSVEELDCTIHVLEKKVNEMEEELERHHMIRDSLELELQALNQRLSTVENFRDCMDSDNYNADRFEDQISRKLHNKCLELQEAHAQIKDLEDEREEQANEITQHKEYISELVIHAEAQAFQYQQKYKNLEAMVSAVKTDASKSVSGAPFSENKAEKNSVRARGSSSPFRCIGNLVQQMNTEKDQELSLAKLRLEELEALASSRQKEICMLNTKLAAAESMTHDVIRDLLGVKLDMTNYANLINQNQLQKLIEDAAQQTHEFIAMEQEIRNLRLQINDLLEERDSCITEIHSKEAEILASKMRVAQLQERVQLLTTRNEMLKADKAKLQRRAVELDDIIKKLGGTQPTGSRSHSISRTRNNDNNHNNYNNNDNDNNNEFGKRLANTDKLLSGVNNNVKKG